MCPINNTSMVRLRRGLIMLLSILQNTHKGDPFQASRIMYMLAESISFGFPCFLFLFSDFITTPTFNADLIPDQPKKVMDTMYEHVVCFYYLKVERFCRILENWQTGNAITSALPSSFQHQIDSLDQFQIESYF